MNVYVKWKFVSCSFWDVASIGLRVSSNVLLLLAFEHSLILLASKDQFVCDNTIPNQ